jgi:hypothetical protein
MFSKRREYLEGTSFKDTGVRQLKDYEEKVDAEIEEQQGKVAKVTEEYRRAQEEANMAKAALAAQVYGDLDSRLRGTLSPELQRRVQAGEAGRVLTMEEVVVQDINLARGSL